MFRAAQPQAANADLSIVYNLLPPGSDQQTWQLNYLTSPLMHNATARRAESLLMTSRQMAHEANDVNRPRFRGSCLV